MCNPARPIRAFCYAGPSALNALPDFLRTIHFLCLLLDASLNISTSHFTSTPSAFEVILQLTRYTNYLLTYLLTYYNLHVNYICLCTQHLCQAYQLN